MQEMILAARFLLGMLFLTSAVTKLRSFPAFELAVQQQGPGILGPISIRTITWLLPPFEFILALLLLAGVWPKLVGLVTLGLLVAFTLPMAINVVKGNRFPCHCFGQTSSKIGVGTLSRNGIMMMISLVLIMTSPWMTSEIWPLYSELMSLSGSDLLALVISDVSLYLFLLKMGEIDTLLRVLITERRGKF